MINPSCGSTLASDVSSRFKAARDLRGGHRNKKLVGECLPLRFCVSRAVSWALRGTSPPLLGECAHLANFVRAWIHARLGARVVAAIQENCPRGGFVSTR
jgi:hypothetical protein